MHSDEYVHVSYDNAQWWISSCVVYSGILFTKRTDVLPQDILKSRNHEI